MLDEVQRWLRSRSWPAADRPLDLLLAAKRAAGARGTVSVVLPALDEEATVGDDRGRDPARPDVAGRAAGRRAGRGRLRVHATVRRRRRPTPARGWCAATTILPRLPALPGKGEVLWRSLLATRGEIVCFVDADLRAFDSSFVSGIVGPLLTDPGVDLVKAMYDRPLETGGDGRPGGRRPGHRAGRPAAAQPALAAAGRLRPAARRGVRGPALAAGAAAVPRRLRRGAGACSSTRWSWSAWTRSPRWTSGCGTTGTRTARRSGGWPRRSTAPRSSGCRAAHLVRPLLTQFERGERRLRAQHAPGRRGGAAPDARHPRIPHPPRGLTSAVRGARADAPGRAPSQGARGSRGGRGGPDAPVGRARLGRCLPARLAA